MIGFTDRERLKVCDSCIVNLKSRNINLNNYKVIVNSFLKLYNANGYKIYLRKPIIKAYKYNIQSSITDFMNDLC